MLPTLGEPNVFARGKYEEDAQDQEILEDRSKGSRISLIVAGKRDEMNLLQPKSAPTLTIGDSIQLSYDYNWCAGTSIEVSNGHDFTQVTKYYRKNGAVKFAWDYNKVDNFEVPSSVVEINKSAFNSHVKNSWRMMYDVPWSNFPLLKAKEKRNASELTQEN